MDSYEKESRGRKRIRNLHLDKKNRCAVRRECSEEGRCNIGNSSTKFCNYCRPSLAIRICNKNRIKGEINNFFKSDNKI